MSLQANAVTVPLKVGHDPIRSLFPSFHISWPTGILLGHLQVGVYGRLSRTAFKIPPPPPQCALHLCCWHSTFLVTKRDWCFHRLDD